MGDVLVGVIDDDDELIGVEAVGAAEDNVAAGHVIGNAEADGAGFSAGREAVATGAGVAVSDLFSGTSAGVGVGFELIESGGVERVALGLPDDFFVPFEAVGFQSVEDEGVGAGDAPGFVDVLHADEPFAVVAARVEPGTDGGDEGSEVEGAGGGGREAAAVAVSHRF